MGIGACEKRARSRIQKRAERMNSYPVCFWIWGKHDQICSALNTRGEAFTLYGVQLLSGTVKIHTWEASCSANTTLKML